MGNTAKNSCPKCLTKFRTGALPSAAEQRRLAKLGIIDLGEPPGVITCPKCTVRLRVVSVRMGTFYRTE
jgi:hypothetical protein